MPQNLSVDIKRQIPEFDSLRAIAVILVMFQHYLGQFPFLMILGSCGVTLFFVLSGFLITQILMYEKSKVDSAKRDGEREIWAVLRIFYIRRSLRIFPIYYVTLGVLYILNIDSIREFFFYHFFYASNFLYSFEIKLDRLAHFWSLAVEEQFYLFWPLVILLVPARRQSGILFISLIVLSLLFKVMVANRFSTESPAFYFLMPSCIESFSFGALIILVRSRVMSKKIIFGVLTVSLLSFVLNQFIIYVAKSGILYEISIVISRTIFSLFAATLLLCIVQGLLNPFWVKLLNNKYLMLIGKISYGIYIFHMFVPYFLISLQKKLNFSLDGSGIYLLLDFLLSFLIAYISFRYIESPINNLKKRFAYL